MEASKQKWQNGKTCYDSLQDFDFNFYLKVFIFRNTFTFKILFHIIQISEFFSTEKCKSFEKFDYKMRAPCREI
jgi:hypothetical protein